MLFDAMFFSFFFFMEINKIEVKLIELKKSIR